MKYILNLAGLALAVALVGCGGSGPSKKQILDYLDLEIGREYPASVNSVDYSLIQNGGITIVKFAAEVELQESLYRAVDSYNDAEAIEEHTKPIMAVADNYPNHLKYTDADKDGVIDDSVRNDYLLIKELQPKGLTVSLMGELNAEQFGKTWMLSKSEERPLELSGLFKGSPRQEVMKAKNSTRAVVIGSAEAKAEIERMVKEAENNLKQIEANYQARLKREAEQKAAKIERLKSQISEFKVAEHWLSAKLTSGLVYVHLDGDNAEVLRVSDLGKGWETYGVEYSVNEEAAFINVTVGDFITIPYSGSFTGSGQTKLNEDVFTEKTDALLTRWNGMQAMFSEDSTLHGFARNSSGANIELQMKFEQITPAGVDQYAVTGYYFPVENREMKRMFTGSFSPSNEDVFAFRTTNKFTGNFRTDFHRYVFQYEVVAKLQFSDGAVSGEFKRGEFFFKKATDKYLSEYNAKFEARENEIYGLLQRGMIHKGTVVLHGIAFGKNHIDVVLQVLQSPTPEGNGLRVRVSAEKLPELYRDMIGSVNTNDATNGGFPIHLDPNSAGFKKVPDSMRDYFWTHERSLDIAVVDGRLVLNGVVLEPLVSTQAMESVANLPATPDSDGVSVLINGNWSSLDYVGTEVDFHEVGNLFSLGKKEKFPEIMMDSPDFEVSSGAVFHIGQKISMRPFIVKLKDRQGEKKHPELFYFTLNEQTGMDEGANFLWEIGDNPAVVETTVALSLSGEGYVVTPVGPLEQGAYAVVVEPPHNVYEKDCLVATFTVK